MPMIETQPDALARLYATSVFELAQEQGGQSAIEDVASELSEILELARADKRFGEFLSSRIVPADKRRASLEKIFKGRVSDLTLKFLLVLNDKDRLANLGAVVAAYDEAVQERFGRVEVDVYTATPVDRAGVDRITATLRKVLGKDPVVHPYTDASMLGGLRVQVGDQLIDASLSTRLRRMRERLTGPGAATARAQAERIIESKP
ncbi:MAG: ATP synthase F1 subunit delta [Phycisphaerales bacterium]